MSERYRTHDVEVAGGRLRVGEWSGEGPTVLAIHGITAHHLAWPLVADALPEHRVLAPDLRGRGRSADLPGPWGLAAHADDAAAVLRALGSGPAIVVGHSMGGFVAVVLAHRHPSLVERVVLVDGGLPFAPAEQATTESALQLIRARLEARFADEASYVGLFRQHPALARDWSPATAGYAAYDATTDGEQVRASASLEAVVADQADILEGTALRDGLAGRRHPWTFLHAPRGFADDPPGLYAPATVRALAAAYPGVKTVLVEDVNHYTITISERGAHAVAGAVVAAI